jgi:hypothetical protein
MPGKRAQSPAGIPHVDFTEKEEAMAQTIAVVVIILAAVALTIYRVFIKPACSCGCSKCHPKKDEEGKFDPLAE